MMSLLNIMGGDYGRLYKVKKETNCGETNRTEKNHNI